MGVYVAIHQPIHLPIQPLTHSWSTKRGGGGFEGSPVVRTSGGGQDDDCTGGVSRVVFLIRGVERLGHPLQEESARRGGRMSQQPVPCHALWGAWRRGQEALSADG